MFSFLDLDTQATIPTSWSGPNPLDPRTTSDDVFDYVSAKLDLCQAPSLEFHLHIIDCTTGGPLFMHKWAVSAPSRFRDAAFRYHQLCAAVIVMHRFGRNRLGRSVKMEL